MKIYATKELAKRTISGTDWPVEIQVYPTRKYRGAQKKWTVARVCNGVAESAETFNTRKEAMAFAEIDD